MKRTITIGLSVATIAICIWFFDLTRFLTLANFQYFAGIHNVLGPVLFVVIYALATIFFLPIIPIAIIGGIVFGVVNGSIYVALGAAIGAITSFIVTRRYGKAFVMKFTRGKLTKLDRYDEKIARNGFLTVLAIRLFPFVPFRAPNYILGLTKIRTRDYVLATVLGVIPESILFVLVGNYFTKLSGGTIIKIVLVVSVLVVLIWIGRWYYKKKKGEEV